jgi:hypothetical protein
MFRATNFEQVYTYREGILRYKAVWFSFKVAGWSSRGGTAVGEHRFGRPVPGRRSRRRGRRTSPEPRARVPPTLGELTVDALAGLTRALTHVALDVRERAETVVRQLEEPVRMIKRCRIRTSGLERVIIR